MDEPSSVQVDTAQISHILSLPDELVEAIVLHLSPRETIAFSATSRRCQRIAQQQHVWRRHCQTVWRFWGKEHAFEKKLELPPDQGEWRQLYHRRVQIDRKAIRTFDTLLLSQQNRYAHMEEISLFGYAVKDLLLALRDDTPDSADDALARRYHANAILGQIHRAIAIEKWLRLQNKQMVRLEEVLGAYDLFVLPGETGDLADLDHELDRIAASIRARDEDFDARSVRSKAIQIARYLRAEQLVGNPSSEEFHALRNNFMTMALLTEPHSSLPLQSVAIYCAVARRLGVNAKPSNYPHHVHAVIEPPPGQTLEGKPTAPTTGDRERMHMDPWRTSDEVPERSLRDRLSQMGASTDQHDQYLGASTTFEAAIRTSRNIMHSVQEARERQRGIFNGDVYFPDIEASWYSMLWSMLILGDSTSETTLRRRRQCLPYLVEQYQMHFPEDTGLFQDKIVHMFEGEREHEILAQLVTKQRIADATPKAPKPRRGPAAVSDVGFRIGHLFRHKRYHYQGIIIGWDLQCAAEARWIQQMRVDDLPRGRQQPFYNVVVEDKTVRYVAEENVERLLTTTPSASLMHLAGRYFKRWDHEASAFASNIRDEFPDD